MPATPTLSPRLPARASASPVCGQDRNCVHPIVSKVGGLAVRLVVREEAYSLPPAILNSPLFQQGRAALLEKVAQGHAFDGETLLPLAVNLEPDGAVITTARSQYSVSAGLRAHFSATPHPSSILPSALQPASSVGVGTIVVTDEGQVLVGHRSATAVVNPATRFVGFGEGAGPADQGDLTQVARRCLVEELGLTLTNDQAARIRTVALGRYATTGSIAVFAIFDARGLGGGFTASALIANAQLAHDAWENSNITCMPIARLPEYLAAGPSTPCAAYCCHLLGSRYA